MTASRTVLVYGDSLALPRAGDGIGPDDTYAEIVRAGLAQRAGAQVALYNRARGGASIATLRREWSEDASYFGPMPDAISIVQAGIVDCAPRPIPGVLRRGIGALPSGAKSALVRLLHNNRALFISAGPMWRTTTPNRFAAIMSEWLGGMTPLTGRIYVLTIAPTTEAMDRHSPGLAQSIDEYNGIIERAASSAGPTVDVIDVHGAITSEPGGLERYVNEIDGHHLTAEGHRLIGQMILARELGRSGG